MAEKFTAGEASMLFTGDDKAFQQTADRVEKSMQGVSKEMEKGADTVEKFFVNVRGYTILTRASSGLKTMGDEAVKMSLAMQQGKASAGELFEKVAEGIPIIGGFISAGRDLRELISGEKAYVAALEQDAKNQDERRELIDKVTLSTRKLGREQEDLQARLNQHPGDSKFVASAEAIVRAGAHAADEIREKAAAAVPLLEEVNKKKLEVSEKLRLAIEDREKISPNLLTAIGDTKVQDLQKQLAGLEKQAAEFRGTIGGVDEALAETAKRGVFTNLLKLVGVQVERGFDAGKAAIERYIALLPKMQSQTAQALESAGGEFQKFRTTVNAFSLDLQHGIISQATFDQLAGTSFWKEGAKSIEQYMNRAKAATEVNLRFLDSWLGAPVARTIESAKKIFNDFVSPFEAKRIPAPEFRARNVSLEGLGAGIQQAAASGADESASIKVAKDQLEAQKELGRSGRAVEKKLEDIKTGLGRSGRAIPS